MFEALEIAIMGSPREALHLRLDETAYFYLDPFCTRISRLYNL